MNAEMSIIPGDGASALPVYIIPAPTKEHAKALAERIAAVKITSAEDFRTAAADLNQITKDYNLINNSRLELAREYDRRRDENVNAQAKPLLDALAKAKANLQSEMEAWDQAEKKRLARAKLEQEQQAAKAEALLLEAERRQEVAADQVATSTTDEGFAAAAASFDKGMAIAGQAQEMEIVSKSAPTAKPAKVRGVAKTDEIKSLEVTDLGKLPITYHLPDVVKIKRHILDGTLDDKTPGIKFTIGPKFRGTGR